MKKWFRHSMEWKAGASLSYTAAVLIYAVVSLLLGEKNVSITVLFELLALCLAGSLLQYVAFTDAVIKKMRYSLRMVVFTLPFLALMTLCAVIFDWFPKGEPFAWVTFFVIFVLALAGFTAGFEIYYRASGRRYDGLLGEYRAKREREKRE